MKQNRQVIDTRQARILSLIRERQEIKVGELAQTFEVSLMTIRRDLQNLERRGLISRFYGGATVEARIGSSKNDENEVSVYMNLISRFAATLVADNDRLFINGSRTALNVLQYIQKKDVLVFTNNGFAVNLKVPSGVSVILSGGDIRGHNGILTGDCAMRNLLMTSANKAFIGCSGISPNGEILCGIPTELGINETMISHAYEYYILADHTKIGKTSSYASYSLEKRGTVITDERAPAAIVDQLRAIGMKVIQVTQEHTEQLL